MTDAFPERFARGAFRAELAFRPIITVWTRGDTGKWTRTITHLEPIYLTFVGDDGEHVKIGEVVDIREDERGVMIVSTLNPPPEESDGPQT